MILDESIKESAKFSFVDLENKFNKKYSYFFDYSKSVFKGMKANITIICPEHGEFSQSPKTHLNSVHGCKKCYMQRKSTTKEEFIKKSKKFHKDKYDYSRINFINMTTHVDIICPIHGAFSQTPKNHLNCGCIQCGIDKLSYNKTDYILEANKIHNGKFDYSLLPDIVKAARNKVSIICPHHGPFKQNPRNHLLTEFCCPKCKTEARSISKEEFIKRATEKHGNKFDYSLVQFKDNKTKIKIICPEHGCQLQLPEYHWTSSFGCIECGLESFKISKEVFIERSKNKYGDNFDYSNINYTDYVSNIELFCKKHGTFTTTPLRHLKSSDGCRSCKIQRLSLNFSNRYSHLPTYIYYIKIIHENKNYFKLGICSAKGVKTIDDSLLRRFSKDIKLGMKYELIFSKFFENGNIAAEIENKILSITKNYKYLNIGIIPTGAGWSEVRDYCFLNNVLEIISIYLK